MTPDEIRNDIIESVKIIDMLLDDIHDQTGYRSEETEKWLVDMKKKYNINQEK